MTAPRVAAVEESLSVLLMDTRKTRVPAGLELASSRLDLKTTYNIYRLTTLN